MGGVYRLCVRMEEIKLEVDYYSGRTADEGRFGFGWTGTNTWSRKCSTSGTVRQMSLTRSVQMTAISRSCAARHRRPTDLGIWSHSGNCRGSEDSAAESGRCWLNCSYLPLKCAEFGEPAC